MSSFTPAPAGWRNVFADVGGNLFVVPMPGWIEGATPDEFDQDSPPEYRRSVVYAPFSATELLPTGGFQPLPAQMAYFCTEYRHVVVLGPDERVPQVDEVSWQLLLRPHVIDQLRSEQDLVPVEGGFRAFVGAIDDTLPDDECDQTVDVKGAVDFLERYVPERVFNGSRVPAPFAELLASGSYFYHDVLRDLSRPGKDRVVRASVGLVEDFYKIS